MGLPGKTPVLVFPAGSEIGLEIHASLKYSHHVELFLPSLTCPLSTGRRRSAGNAMTSSKSRLPSGSSR